MPGEVLLANVQLEMDSEGPWGELVLLRGHWGKAKGKRKRHHTEGLVWLKLSGGCELWQHSHGLSPPVPASWAAQFPVRGVPRAPGARGSEMKLWRGSRALAV